MTNNSEQSDLKHLHMKTLQNLSTAILLVLTSSAFANGGDDLNNTNNTDNESTLTLIVVDVKSPSCNGGDNGSAKVIAQGGKAPYTYNWNTFPAQITPQATNLTSGIYFVEVTDAKGDVYYVSVHVTDPNTSTFNETIVQSDIDLTASVTGNNAPYIFELNGEKADSKSIDNLPVGLHKLVITDANECEMVQYIQVFEVQDHPNGSTENSTQNEPTEIKENQEQLKSKNDRHVQASDLIPTISTGNTQNLVTVSSH